MTWNVLSSQLTACTAETTQAPATTGPAALSRFVALTCPADVNHGAQQTSSRQLRMFCAGGYAAYLSTRAVRPWAGPPDDCFSALVARRSAVKHAIAAVAPKLPGRACA
jgi:hypothetical protein